MVAVELFLDDRGDFIFVEAETRAIAVADRGIDLDALEGDKVVSTFDFRRLRCCSLCSLHPVVTSVVDARFRLVMLGDRLLLSAATGDSVANAEALVFRREERVTGLWYSLTRSVPLR